MSRSKVLALILAGGEGGRLSVLTEQRAKPAMPYAGVYRLIDFALSNCMHSQLSDVWVIEQYQPHSLNEHLANGRPWDLDRTYGGLQVLSPYTSRGADDDESGFAEGNADAIYRNKSLIREFDPDILLVLSADHIYQLDFRDVIERHVARKAEVTMVTTKVPLKDAGRYGTVKVNRRGRVTSFAYKPERPKSDLVTTEVFVYDARKLLESLEHLAAEGADQKGGKNKKASKGGGNGAEAKLKDFGHELLPHLVSEGHAYEYRFDGYWRDVGTVESYWQSHMDLLAPEPALNLDDPRWPILTYGNQHLPAHIHASARIENSLIAPGCVVRGHVVRSVLAPGCVIEEGASVYDSILFHDALIEAGAVVNNAVLDERVSVGRGAAVGGQSAIEGQSKPQPKNIPKITLVGRDLQIEARARVRAGTHLAPKDDRQG